MAYQIGLTEEEMTELDELLHREVESRRVELRRTRNPEYRAEVERRIQMAHHVMESIEQARAQSPAA